MNRIAKLFDHGFECECDACRNCEPVDHSEWDYLELWGMVQRERKLRRQAEDEQSAAFLSGVAVAITLEVALVTFTLLAYGLLSVIARAWR